MSWHYNPQTQRTEPQPDGVIGRRDLEDAVERMLKTGIRNRNEIVDCLAALSGLSWGEVAFTVNLVCDVLSTKGQAYVASGQKPPPRIARRRPVLRGHLAEHV
jgi:hypothetical protein